MQLMDAVVNYLTHREYRFHTEQNLVYFTVRGRTGVIPVFLLCKEELLVTVARYRKAIPDEMRLEVGEYLHLVNFGLLLGNFEMDYEQGDVRFKTCLYTGNSLPPQEVLARYINTPPVMLERYGLGMDAIVEGGEIAATALELVDALI